MQQNQSGELGEAELVDVSMEFWLNHHNSLTDTGSSMTQLLMFQRGYKYCMDVYERRRTTD